MKRFLLILILCMLCLVGCTEEDSLEANVQKKETLSEKYSVGDEVDLCGKKFNIYKLDNENDEIYLLAQSNIATTVFSDEERSYKYEHDYEGSLVEGYVNRFIDDLEDRGVVIKSSGIIDKDDLYDLGFGHSDELSGLPYRCETVPEFVKY